MEFSFWGFLGFLLDIFEEIFKKVLKESLLAHWFFWLIYKLRMLQLFCVRTGWNPFKKVKKKGWPQIIRNVEKSISTFHTFFSKNAKKPSRNPWNSHFGFFRGWTPPERTRTAPDTSEVVLSHCNPRMSTTANHNKRAPHTLISPARDARWKPKESFRISSSLCP